MGERLSHTQQALVRFQARVHTRGGACIAQKWVYGLSVTPENLHWLAGILEGEGSFMRGIPSSPNRVRIAVQMTDRDVIERVARLWNGAVYECKARNPRHKASYRAQLDRSGAVALMILLRPLMGQRRQGQIDAAISSYNAGAALDARRNRRALTDNQVREARRRYRAGESGSALAQEYGLFNTGFYRMLNGETYSDVDESSCLAPG